DAECGTALRVALLHDRAARGQRIARIRGAVKLDVLHAEERPARFGEVFDGEADGGAEQEQGVDHHAWMAVRARILGVEVKRCEAQRERREQRVVGFRERASPVVLVLSYRRTNLVAKKGKR